MNQAQKKKVAAALIKAANALEAKAEVTASGDPSVMAGDILRQGMNHPALKAMMDSSDVEKALIKARKDQKALEKFGSHDISAPALLHGAVIKELEDYYKTVGMVLNQIKKRIPKSSIR